MKLKHDKSRLNCLTHHGLWHLLTLCHNQLQKVKVVAFRLAHFHVLFIFFLLGYIIFSKSFDLSFRTFTLFLLFYFFIFTNMAIQLAEGKVCTYLQEYHQSIQNYESYIYRSLTRTSHGDDISY